MTKEQLNEDLFHACLREHKHGVFECIRNGANVNSINEYGDTPLHWAVEKGKLRIIKDLIKAGALINAQNRDGKTPLHIAAFYGHAKIVKLLKQAMKEEA